MEKSVFMLGHKEKFYTRVDFCFPRFSTENHSPFLSIGFPQFSFPQSTILVENKFSSAQFIVHSESLWNRFAMIERIITVHCALGK